MVDDILAEVAVFNPQACYVQPNATEDWSVSTVSRSGLGGSDGEVVEEFTLSGGSDVDPPPRETDTAERVFSYDSEHVYRFSRPADQGCVCERVEREGCVVQNVTADEDSLAVTFLVEDTETLRAVIDTLEETGESVRLRRLVENPRGESSGRPTVLDRDVLTGRQREALECAYEMGYFEHPREVSAGEVADRLDITTSTFTEHLAAAQRKLLDDLLEA
ncbi:helix-turn-helix domain-containing protein [Haloarcula salinisoli]|uniref:Helix-turn-helix domain-containing protein n=1 Tax=Haloarcula salinisoli TaxID=2487746 RepID=A0A8J8C9P1_9EURY|nr:helix-turn-helix domain-containing protein [Halomicroarcula salinisoli]MBX0286369.1 helix-turn-helix domain-containing protein [Halomicroarcula salinisoli]MBX0302143.1 helix-turn-helix domain-containing protein [Halomicroarcula salinisoli]